VAATVHRRDIRYFVQKDQCVLHSLPVIRYRHTRIFVRDSG
jgi:hypothetical protein